MNTKKRLTLLAACMALASSDLSAQTIHLSDHAVIEPHQDVRLGNIATIDGGDAQTSAALADIVILPAIENNKKIRAESVLMAVIAQLGSTATANELQLSGAAECEISVGTPAAPTAPSAAPAAPTPSPTIAAAPAQPESAPVVTASVATAPPAVPETVTLSKLIITRLEQELAAGPNELVVSFETVNPLLDQPVEAGAQWQFQPMTRTLLGTVQWHAEMVQKSRVLHSLSVETKVQKHEVVLVAATQIPAGSVMTKEQFVLQDVLLDRNLPTLFTKEKDVIGLEAQRAIVVGSQLDQRDFKPVQMAQIGDAVTVMFVSGSLKVKMNGRAMECGKLHDQIRIRNEVTHDEYQAVLIGKTLAVVGGTLTDAQEQLLRETR